MYYYKVLNERDEEIFHSTSKKDCELWFTGENYIVRIDLETGERRIFKEWYELLNKNKEFEPTAEEVTKSASEMMPEF